MVYNILQGKERKGGMIDWYLQLYQVKERKGGVVGIYQLTNLCVILMCDSCNSVFLLADLFPSGTLLPVGLHQAGL